MVILLRIFWTIYTETKINTIFEICADMYI